jgi:hypothetical protein
MSRAWSLVGLLSLMVSSGCAMCASPYDDCPPTFLGPKGEGDPCFDLHLRAGSILGPAPVVSYGGEQVIEEGVITSPNESAAPTEAEPIPTPAADAPLETEQPRIEPRPDSGADRGAQRTRVVSGVARAFRR